MRLRVTRSGNTDKTEIVVCRVCAYKTIGNDLAKILKILLLFRTINKIVTRSYGFNMEISKCLLNWPILSILEQRFISSIDMAVIHGEVGTEALILTDDRMVYALGCNRDGCSGTGDTHCLMVPTKVEILCEKNIKTFAHGSSSHVLALTEDGKVYSWGNNDIYQLGNKFDNTNSNGTPTLVQENLSGTFVVDIACGNYHSLALTGDGEVYEWGVSKHLPYACDDHTYIMAPRKVQSTFASKRIVCISCGDSFSMAVTADGEVYSWGNNEFGQLGNGNYNNQEQPCKVKKLTGIVIEKLVCGYAHTLALSNEGILYTWGENTYGELGFPTPIKACKPLQLKAPLMGRVLDMAASHYSHISVAMGEGNRVFVWGRCLQQKVKIPMLTPYRCLYDALACYATPGVMHKPFLLYVKGMTNITDCLKAAFDDPTTSDLTIRVEGSPIHVHKAILKLRCQHFRTMFQDHWTENNQSVIEHEEFSYDVYRAFLEYLYTGEINVPVEDAEEFLDLTNAYFESELQSRLIRLIKKDITVKYTIPLYTAAIRYNIKELEEYCFEFAINHMTAVARRPSFFRLDELTKKSFAIAANACASKTPVVKLYQNFNTNRHNLMKWRIIRLLEPKFISKIHMVLVCNVGCSALIVTKDGIVYGLGHNATGCLGTGDTCSNFCPTEVKELSGKGIKTFAYSENQTLALTEKGEVYSWEHFYDTSCKYEPTFQDLTPTLVEGYPSETFIVDIACGKYHSLALTNDGKVYAWGKNMYGQVNGSKSFIRKTCEMLCVTLPGKKFLYIRCCSESSMAVTDEGEVYSWGCNTNGELGQGHINEAVGVHKVLIPTEVLIEKIACGKSHTLALSNAGVVYVWGNNNYKQLGWFQKENSCTPVKLQVKKMGRVLDVAASPYDDISVALCEHNWVFAWGLCLQLCFLPTRIPYECLHDAFAHLTRYGIMHQPLIVYSEEEMSITDNLREAFDDITTSDLTIHVEDKPIYVHKTILKLRSQYFKTMFQEQWADNNHSAIKLGQFCYNVYRAFLEYLYTDEIYLAAENIHELLDLAVIYSDSVLRDRCILLSKSQMKIDNVASLYSISIKHDLKELEQFCLNLVVNNLSTVIETLDFLKLDEFTIKSLMIKAVKARANLDK